MLQTLKAYVHVGVDVGNPDEQKHSVFQPTPRCRSWAGLGVHSREAEGFCHAHASHLTGAIMCSLDPT
eukprot:1161221-Pelagomonas_calceolata.AAC.5